ncbi:hypothetical protein [Nocardioides marmoraquaticus]
MGWGRRVVERFRTDGAPRVLVLVVVVAGFVVWDRSNDVDLRDDLARQVRDSEASGRYVVPLTRAQADRFGNGEGPTNNRAAELTGAGNADLRPVFEAAAAAHWPDDDEFLAGIRDRHPFCRYWAVGPHLSGRADEVLQLCWDSKRPRARPSSSAGLSLVKD